MSKLILYHSKLHEFIDLFLLYSWSRYMRKHLGLQLVPKKIYFQEDIQEYLWLKGIVAPDYCRSAWK